VENRWPFRLHATYNETIERALNVYEEVNREIHSTACIGSSIIAKQFRQQHRAREGAGGGIAVQNRMAFQGEYFVARYGSQQAKRTPPIRRMLETGVRWEQAPTRPAFRVTTHTFPLLAYHR